MATKRRFMRIGSRDATARTASCAIRLPRPSRERPCSSDWVLADIHMKGYPFPDTEVAVYWAREGVLPIFPISPGRYRIIANIPPSGGDHPRDPTLEEIAAIVEQRGPKGVKLFDPIWLSGFRINARKVAKLSRGAGFPLRRRRACSQPSRRRGHEHGDAGRVQSRLETGLGHPRNGRRSAARHL